jgi:hypothetical protein
VSFAWTSSLGETATPEHVLDDAGALVVVLVALDVGALVSVVVVVMVVVVVDARAVVAVVLEAVAPFVVVVWQAFALLPFAQFGPADAGGASCRFNAANTPRSDSTSSATIERRW